MNKTLLFLVVSCLAVSHYFKAKNPRPNIEINKQQSALNIDHNLLTFFSLGNKRLISSTLWIITLLESDTEHYKKKDLNSWLYHRFNSISILDPLFLNNYLFGGQYLTIIKDDIAGGEQLLVKGHSYFPDNYNLIFALAYLSVFEKQDYQRGVKYYQLIEKFPQAPKNIRSLIHKLQFYQAGQDLKIAFESVLLTYNQIPESPLKKKLRADLYSIKAQLDLECLNDNIENCDKLDFDGNPYIKRGQKYFAPKEFLPYKIFKR